MYCTNCGNEVNGKFCTQCGANISLGETHEIAPHEPNIPSTDPKTMYSDNAKVLEVNAGEITLSGQTRFTTTIIIENNNVTVRKYMNTKSYSEPRDYVFNINNITGLRRKKVGVPRKIHKIRYAVAALLVVFTFTGFYWLIAGIALAVFNYINSCYLAIEIRLNTGNNIDVYYTDPDDATIIEHALTHNI
ncbi:hypothetical protein M2146_000355 [Lachnospiraceae bacterium PF1-22]|uniref:zinc ribbon domain-containing protein n=1 Tax=Ohessyouella blattaphilus TaxID=2949333 RepID=UPI003E2AA63D